MDIWAISTFWLFWIVLLWTCVYMCLYEYLISVLLVMYLGVKFQGHMVSLCLTIWRITKSIGWTILSSHQQYMRVPVSPSPLQHLLFFSFLFCLFVCLLLFCFFIATVVGVKSYHIVVFICISLLINGIEHVFMCLHIFFEEMPIHVLWSLWIGLSVFLLLNCKNF